MRSFGSLLLIFFCSPLYFLIRGRWIAAILNGCVYLVAIPLLFVFGLGIVPWTMAVAHGMWDFYRFNREAEMQRQAQLIVDAQQTTSD